MQETPVWTLVQEDATCQGAPNAMSHNYGTCAPESRAQSPGGLEPVLCKKRSRHPEMPLPATREQPLLPAARETQLAAVTTQSSQKVSKYS